VSTFSDSRGSWQAPGKTWESSRTYHSGLGFSQIFRTGILMAGLIALLVWMGRIIGGYQGMFLFGAIGVLFNLGSWWFSDRITLAMYRAIPADPAQFPELYDIVRELTQRAGMPMPAVYIIPTMQPNAFATGRNPEHAAVAATEGILRMLNARELRGVLAHELSHVRNRDTLISSIAASIAGLISSIGSMIRWGFMLGGMGRRDDRDEGSGLEMLALAIVAPIVAMLVQLAISRSREYGADETGARLSGDPDALADALIRIEQGVEAIPDRQAGLATAHMFIVNPFSGKALMSLLSTHPPTEDRVARLRQMAEQMG
jgi:heat shock protein HtpX